MKGKRKTFINEQYAHIYTVNKSGVSGHVQGQPPPPAGPQPASTGPRPLPWPTTGLPLAQPPQPPPPSTAPPEPSLASWLTHRQQQHQQKQQQQQALPPSTLSSRETPFRRASSTPGEPSCDQLQSSLLAIGSNWLLSQSRCRP